MVISPTDCKNSTILRDNLLDKVYKTEFTRNSILFDITGDLEKSILTDESIVSLETNLWNKLYKFVNKKEKEKEKDYKFLISNELNDILNLVQEDSLQDLKSNTYVSFALAKSVQDELLMSFKNSLLSDKLPTGDALFFWSSILFILKEQLVEISAFKLGISLELASEIKKFSYFDAMRIFSKVDILFVPRFTEKVFANILYTNYKKEAPIVKNYFLMLKHLQVISGCNCDVNDILKKFETLRKYDLAKL